jgi:hypothetical protein
MKKYEEILRQDEQAIKHKGSPTSTMRDIWLRKLQISLLKDQLRKNPVKMILHQ